MCAEMFDRWESAEEGISFNDRVTALVLVFAALPQLGDFAQARFSGPLPLCL